MSDLSLMSLAVQKAEWLAARQAIVAQNIANANTPGYKSRDLVPFEAVLQTTGFRMVSTHAGHLAANGATGGAPALVSSISRAESTANGNNVSLEGEMAKLGETTGQYALTTSIIKSFHKMIMSSLKA
jgi:flagellar basal-body rod protein FlgB